MATKLKPIILYGVKHKDEDWLYIPEDLAPTKRDAQDIKRCNYNGVGGVQVIKLKMVQI